MDSSLQIRQAHTLLAELSAVLGEELALDAALTCCLQFGGSVEVVIELHADAGVLSFRSEIFHASECTPAMLLAALSINYGQLPDPVCVAADAESGLLMLFGILRLQQATGEQVLALVHDLVQQSQIRSAELRDAAGSMTAAEVSDIKEAIASQPMRA